MANCGIVMSQVNKRFLLHYTLATPFVIFQSLKLQNIRATKYIGSSFTTCVFSLRNYVKMTSYSWAVECLSVGSFAAERTWSVSVTIYWCLQMLKPRINLAIFASITSNFLASFPGHFSYGLGTRLANSWSSIKFYSSDILRNHIQNSNRNYTVASGMHSGLLRVTWLDTVTKEMFKITTV